MDILSYGSPFKNLMRSFLELINQDTSSVDTAEGFEFMSKDFVVVVKQHPNHLPPFQNERLIIEIHLLCIFMTSTAEIANALLMLHRINNAARFHHDWLATIDPDDMLLMVYTVPIGNSTAETLQNDIADGLERAKALESLWNDAKKIRAPKNQAAIRETIAARESKNENQNIDNNITTSSESNNNTTGTPPEDLGNFFDRA